MIDSAVTLLPDPELADDCDCLAGANVEGDVVHGRHPTALRIEACRQAADLQER